MRAWGQYGWEEIKDSKGFNEQRKGVQSPGEKKTVNEKERNSFLWYHREVGENRLGESVLSREKMTATAGSGLVQSKEFFKRINLTPMPQFPPFYNGA